MICILSQKKKSRSSLTFFDGLSSFFNFYKPEEVSGYWKVLIRKGQKREETEDNSMFASFLSL